MTPTILIAVLLGLLFLSLVLVCVLLYRINVTLTTGNVLTTLVRDEVRELRLKSRARVGQAGFGSTPNSDKGVTLVRSGRAARSRRVVAGGDASSEQHRVLTEQLGGDNEPDVSNE